MDVIETEVRELMTPVEGVCSGIESSALITDGKKFVESVRKCSYTDNSIHKKDKMILSNASGTVSNVFSTCEDPTAAFSCDFELSPDINCQAGRHKKAVPQKKKKMLKRSSVRDEDVRNSNLSATGHQEVCCYKSEEQSLESEHIVMENVLIGEFNKVSLLNNNDLPSISSVEEHTQGHRHKTAHVASCSSQTKDSAFVGSEEKSLIGENGRETRRQDREVQAELQHAVNLSVSPNIHICKKKLDTSSAVDVHRQLEVSDSLFQVQQDTCIGERGEKTQYERPEFQNIVSWDDDSFLCEVCDITLPNSVCIDHLMGQQHTKNLAAAAVNIERIWNMVRELEGGKTGNVYMTARNRFSCTLCNKNIHVTDVVPHVGGSTHQQKLKELKETNRKHTNRSQKWKLHNVHSIWNEIYAAENGKWSNIKCVSPEMFYCEPCKTSLPVQEVLAHVTAASHQQAIRAPEIIHMNERLIRIADILWQQMHDADRTHEAYFNVDNKTVLYCISCYARVPATVINVTDHIRGKTHMSTVVRNLLSEHLSVMAQTNGSLEENSQNFRPIQTQKFGKGKLKKKSECSSENLSDSRSSQLQIKTKVYSAQEELVKALMPKEKVGSEQNASKCQGKSVLFHCVVCDTETESKELWYQHKCSQEHSLKTSKLVAEGKNPITYNCPICCATIFCIESDLVKHTCQKVQNEGQLHIFSEMAGCAHQVNERTAAELYHQEDVKDEDQDDKTANVPRIVVSGKNNTFMYNYAVKLVCATTKCWLLSLAVFMETVPPLDADSCPVCQKFKFSLMEPVGFVQCS
jgi:hypothetical protein